MKKFYDADYIIRKNNEYEEKLIYDSPVEVKLRKMIEDATNACNIQQEKLREQKAKLEAHRKLREQKKKQESGEPSEEDFEQGMSM